MKFGDKDHANWIKNAEAVIAESNTSQFRKELTLLLHTWNIGDGSDTPVAVLAEYLESCLLAFDVATKQRETRINRDNQQYNAEESE